MDAETRLDSFENSRLWHQERRMILNLFRLLFGAEVVVIPLSLSIYLYKYKLWRLWAKTFFCCCCHGRRLWPKRSFVAMVAGACDSRLTTWGLGILLTLRGKWWKSDSPRVVTDLPSREIIVRSKNRWDRLSPPDAVDWACAVRMSSVMSDLALSLRFWLNL